LVITEDAAHIKACRKLGTATLQFGKDFTDWSEAPALVRRLANPAAAIDHPAIDTEEAAAFRRSLSEHGQLAESDGPLAPGVTHVIEHDDEGNEVLRRKRFSAI
jgi:hypothetical protein